MINKRATKENKVKVTFVLREDQPFRRASVVGDFNDWDPLANPFRRRSNRTFSTAVELEPGGRYAFRYLAEGGRWFDEPECDGHAPSAHGTDNCIVAT